jgi:hypothetical protein
VPPAVCAASPQSTTPSSLLPHWPPLPVCYIT